MRVLATFRAAYLSVQKRAILNGLGFGMVIALAWLMPAAAQQTIFVDPRAQGDVIVDLSVLDELGPPPATAGASNQNTRQNIDKRNQEVIVLHPPGQKPAQKSAAKASNPAPQTPVANATPASSSAKTKNTKKTAPESHVASSARLPESESKAPAPTAPPAPTTRTTQAAAATPSGEPPAPVSVKPSVVSAIPPAGSKPAPSANAEPASRAPAATPAPPPPPPAVTASPSAAPQLASKPPGGQPASMQRPGSEALAVSFSKSSTELSDSAKNALERVAETLKKNGNTRVQLIAYASGDDAQASEARRTSLIRGLAVRTYLIEHGISSSRIDVRALGNKNESGNADRVDLMLSK